MAKKAKSPKAKACHPYVKPYLDSSVFIAWIKGEKVKQKDSDKIIDRGRIGEHILRLAERGEFPIVISGLTIAEVHKAKHKPKLTEIENNGTLQYFQHSFIAVQIIDRGIGEEANRLCREYQAEKLMPADAIHLACAKRAGCDVLLAWDGPLTRIPEPGIRIEHPRMLGQFEMFDEPVNPEQTHGPTKKPQDNISPDVSSLGNSPDDPGRTSESPKAHPIATDAQPKESHRKNKPPQAEAAPAQVKRTADKRSPEQSNSPTN